MKPPIVAAIAGISFLAGAAVSKLILFSAKTPLPEISPQTKSELQNSTLQFIEDNRDRLDGEIVKVEGRVSKDAADHYWLGSTDDDGLHKGYALQLSNWPFPGSPQQDSATRVMKLVGRFARGGDIGDPDRPGFSARGRDLLIGPMQVILPDGSEPAGKSE